LNQLSTEAFYRQIQSIWNDTAAWPEYKKAMQSVFSVSKLTQDPARDPARWALLPGLCCQAAGGDPGWADRLAVVWFLFYTAAHLFDKVEDQDPAEEGIPEMAPGVTINLATGMLVAASHSLNQMQLGALTQLHTTQIADEFYRTILTMCNGQHLDLIQGQPSLAEWMQISEAKSGAFFRLACQSGASLATQDTARLAGFGEYGFHLGLLLQILDDVGDFHQAATGEQPVLSQDAGRSLAVAYARQVLPADQQAILSENLATASQNAASAQQVIDLLKQCGAGLYLFTEMERQRVLGLQSLKTAHPGLPAGEILIDLLTDLGSDISQNSL
jgi:geranylgeranyl pyrophosphate synthase